MESPGVDAPPDDGDDGSAALGRSAPVAVPPLTPMRLAVAVARILITSIALVVLYAAAPVDTRTTRGAVIVMVIAAAVFVMVFVHHLRALSHTPYPILRAANLLTTTILLFILGFSLTYLALAEADPTSFSEPLGKVSAVYFTVTVLATVGFGDITATTDTTRAVVTLQMLSGLSLLGVLVRYVVGITSRRVTTMRNQA